MTMTTQKASTPLARAIAAQARVQRARERAAAAVKERDAAVRELRDAGGMSLPQIAAAMDLSLGTVKAIVR